MELLSHLAKLIKENFLLVLILVVGFLLRIIATSPGYYYPIGDELLAGQAIHMLVKHTFSLEPQYFGYPPLVPWIMLSAFILVFIPSSFLKVILTHWKEIYLYLPIFVIPLSVFLLILKKIFRVTIKRFLAISFFSFWIVLILGGILAISSVPILQREMLGRDWIDALYWGRYLTAFIGSLVILLTYKVALVYFENKNVALLSSLFVSLNYRLVLNSHIGLPDSYTVFFLLLSLLSIGHLLRKPSFWVYLLTFLSMASFFMIKYQTHIVLPFLVAHTSISLKNAKKSAFKFLKNFFNLKVLAASSLGLGFILIAHFYHFQNLTKVLEINYYESAKYGFGRNIFDLYPISYFYHVGIGPLLSLISLIGMGLALARKRTRLTSIIILATLPTYGFLYLYYTNGGFYTRNLISVIPIFLIFAGFFVYKIYEVLPKTSTRLKRLSALILVTIIFFLVKDNLRNSIVTANAYSKEAPRVAAQKWLEQNIKGNLIFGRFTGTPTPSDSLVQSENLLPYYKAFSYQEMLDEKYDYISIELSNLRDQFVWWTRQVPFIAIKFWNKPNDLLSQNYYALAFRELLWSHGKVTFISPWQAPSHNFAIFYIDKNKFRNIIFLPIKKYTDFRKAWIPLYFVPNHQKDPRDILVVNEKSLMIKSGRILPGSIRLQSEDFKVKPNHIYKIVGQIKNDHETQKDERDGFMRLDFYKDASPKNILSRPIVSFVSKRIFGNPDWHKVEIVAIAPANVKFATIGFQSDGNSTSSFYLQNVEIYESKEEINDTGSHFTITDDDLFLPNNEGVL